jgi:hypothetical protein
LGYLSACHLANDGQPITTSTHLLLWSEQLGSQLVKLRIVAGNIRTMSVVINFGRNRTQLGKNDRVRLVEGSKLVNHR